MFGFWARVAPGFRGTTLLGVLSTCNSNHLGPTEFNSAQQGLESGSGPGGRRNQRGSAQGAANYLAEDLGLPVEHSAAARGARATPVTTIGRDSINIALHIKDETTAWIGPIKAV